MVAIESIVLTKTSLLASSLSASYLSASIVVVTGAGAPLKITATPLTTEPGWKIINALMRLKGIKSKRINE